MTDCDFCGSSEHSEHNCSLSYLARQAEALERIAEVLEKMDQKENRTGISVEVRPMNACIDNYIFEVLQDYHQSFRRSALAGV